LAAAGYVSYIEAEAERRDEDDETTTNEPET
jgi:hypothetical protein